MTSIIIDLNFLEEHKTIQQKKNLTFNEKYLSRLYQTQFLKATIIFAFLIHVSFFSWF